MKPLAPLAILALTLAPSLAHAAPAGDAAGGKGLSIVLVIAVVSLVPFLFLSLTAFVKISTVLQITKSAIGAQSVPSSAVVIALSGALTLLAMAPTATVVAERAAPLLSDRIEDAAAVARLADAAREPMRAFLRANASDRERGRFLEVARSARPEADRGKVSEADFSVLAPAFVVTELGEAFAVGFLIFLPFLVIDLVVANVLASLGLQNLGVTQVSLPFKLLLFVAVDGWGLLAQALVAGYR